MRVKQTRVTIETCRDVKKQVLGAAAQGDFVIDLSGVEQVQSVMLSILLSAERAAQARGEHVRIENAPDALKTLSTLYGVDELLRQNAAA